MFTTGQSDTISQFAILSAMEAEIFLLQAVCGHTNPGTTRPFFSYKLCVFYKLYTMLKYSNVFSLFMKKGIWNLVW